MRQIEQLYESMKAVGREDELFQPVRAVPTTAPIGTLIIPGDRFVHIKSAGVYETLCLYIAIVGNWRDKDLISIPALGDVHLEASTPLRPGDEKCFVIYTGVPRGLIFAREAHEFRERFAHLIGG